MTELVRLPVDVVVGDLIAAQAARAGTSAVPIVSIGGDLLAAGLVASLARPGGNVTGVSFQDAEGGGKRLQLLKQTVPQASNVAVLWNPFHPAKGGEWRATQEAARAVGVTLHPVEVRGPEDFESAFAAITKARADALIVFSWSLTIVHHQRIVDAATKARLPMISELREFAQAGGLMAYGASLDDMRRRGARYVDRILRGAKPADLPVEQPTKYEFVINLKTAKALGLTIPPAVLARADEVIQ